MIPAVADIHTHDPMALDAVINLDRDMVMRDGALYSVGVHPWDHEPDFGWVETMASHPQVVMIGECGLDRLRGPALDVQHEMLTRHVALSERLGKPLLLHVVRAYAEILALHKRVRPSQPWIVHGFRGKPALALQLVEAGFYLSVGPDCPQATVAVIPSVRLLPDTD